MISIWRPSRLGRSAALLFRSLDVPHVRAILLLLLGSRSVLFCINTTNSPEYGFHHEALDDSYRTMLVTAISTFRLAALAGWRRTPQGSATEFLDGMIRGREAAAWPMAFCFSRRWLQGAGGHFRVCRRWYSRQKVYRQDGFRWTPLVKIDDIKTTGESTY